MPCRYIREEYLTSEHVDLLDAHAERFFFRLFLAVDDFGRFEANEKILRSRVYPLKDGIRTADISRYLDACEKAGLICLYTSAGKRYLEIYRFAQSRANCRTARSKFPAPPENACNLQADDNNLQADDNNLQADDNNLQADDNNLQADDNNLRTLAADNENENENENDIERDTRIPAHSANTSPHSLPPGGNVPPAGGPLQKIQKFSQPSIQEVAAYCIERKNNIDPAAFCDFYTTKGWMIGSSKMKDWRAAVRTWERRRRMENSPKYQNSKFSEAF